MDDTLTRNNVLINLLLIYSKEHVSISASLAEIARLEEGSEGKAAELELWHFYSKPVSVRHQQAKILWEATMWEKGAQESWKLLIERS